MGFFDCWRRKIHCWREGHNWKESLVRDFGAVREGRVCKRCGLSRRTTNTAVVQEPLNLSNFKGVLFCPFCGDTGPEVSDEEIVCDSHGTILSVKSDENSDKKATEGDGSE